MLFLNCSVYIYCKQLVIINLDIFDKCGYFMHGREVLISSNINDICGPRFVLYRIDLLLANSSSILTRIHK